MLDDFFFLRVPGLLKFIKKCFYILCGIFEGSRHNTVQNHLEHMTKVVLKCAKLHQKSGFEHVACPMAVRESRMCPVAAQESRTCPVTFQKDKSLSAR